MRHEIERRTGSHSGLFQRYDLEVAVLSAPSPDHANEDRFVFAAPGEPLAENARNGYLFAVADGSSAGGRGALASQALVDALSTLLGDSRATLLRPDLLEFRFHEANDRVAQEVGGHTTATALWFWEEPGPPPRLEAGWSHVGDSRLYQRRHDGGWLPLTQDHSRGSGLSRAIGDGAGLLVESGRLHPELGDWFVLATDGVWKRARPAKLHLRKSDHNPEELTLLLARTARENGSRDDATVIALRVVEHFHEAADRGHTAINR